MNLREHNYPTILLFRKLYMETENVHVILHMIKELSDLRAFISKHIPNGKDKLIGHTKALQFKSYVQDDGWFVMQ